MWRIWRRKFAWQNLCPIKFADPFGFIVVMVRAEQPVTVDDVIAADPDDYPDVHVEYKANNWGRLNGRIVVVDYGLWDAQEVRQQREYLRLFPNKRI